MTVTAAAGWYVDPYAPAQWRYFDGAAWTGHSQPMAAPAGPPASATPHAPATYPPATYPPATYNTAVAPTSATPSPAAHAPSVYAPSVYAPSAYAPVAYAAGTDATAAGNDDLRWLVPVGRSGLSIAAGYAGIAALLCFYTAPLALVLGLLALRGLRDSTQGGRGRAWFATVVGGLGTLTLVAWTLAIALHAPGFS